LFVGHAECFFALFDGEFEGDVWQGYGPGGKCGLVEIVLLGFDLTSAQEARGMDGRRVFVLHGFGVLPFTAHRAGDRGEAGVKTPRPAGHDSESTVESLAVLGQHPGFVG
jgi:hypothetical protein